MSFWLEAKFPISEKWFSVDCLLDACDGDFERLLVCSFDSYHQPKCCNADASDTPRDNSGVGGRSHAHFRARNRDLARTDSDTRGVRIQGSRDRIQVLNIDPPVGTHLKVGQTYYFVVRVQFQLNT
jgi:hypothetical protein